MVHTFKKLYATVTILLASMTAHAQGIEDYSLSQNNEDCCAPVCCDTSACCGQGFVSVDFLYWLAYEDGLDVCGSSESIDIVNPGGGVVSIFRGKTHDPDFEWAPGFRVGAGYQFASRCWDIGACWTHFDTRAKRHNGDEQKFHWRLNFDVVDAVIGTYYDLGSCFTVRAFAGLRGAYIDQKVKNTSANFTVETLNHTHNKETFKGIGPVSGFEINWDLGCGWGIYANSAISGLWGRFKVDFDEVDAFPFGVNINKLRRHLDACQLVLDGGAGISWRKCFWENKEFVVKIGWEQHRYFNHNRFGEYGDLCLGGGVVSAGVAF